MRLHPVCELNYGKPGGRKPGTDGTLHRFSLNGSAFCCSSASGFRRRPLLGNRLCHPCPLEVWAAFPYERVAQTHAFLAFVCDSSSVHGVSCLDVKILVDIPMLKARRKAKCAHLCYLLRAAQRKLQAAFLRKNTWSLWVSGASSWSRWRRQQKRLSVVSGPLSVDAVSENW